MSKHTPGSWRVDVCPKATPSRRILADGYGLVASVHCHTSPLMNLPQAAHDATADANAEFIVRAVNSHDALLAACEAARAFLEDGYPPEEISPEEAAIRGQLDAAIAAAKGGAE